MFDEFSEQAAYFVPIEIAVGHCIASYVACAKETVRINNINSVRRKEDKHLFGSLIVFL